ncbi:Pogo transposable element with, partial [Brachionus plicatilis]
MKVQNTVNNSPFRASDGAKRVKVSTSGNERSRMSLAVSSAANGNKLPIYVIIPRRTELPEYDSPENVAIAYKTGATFNDDMIIDYVRRVVLSYKNHCGFEKIYLIIDHAKCHLTLKVKQYCNDNNIELFYIPPRLTNILQPADVMWFRSFKRRYHEMWTD